MKPNFSMDELLALLEQQRGPDIQGFSVAELAALLGRSENWVLARLRKLSEKGIIGVGYRKKYRIDGKSCQIPVYYVRKEKIGESV